MKKEKSWWLKKAGDHITDITQKKVINSLVNSIFLSEDIIRRYLLDKNVPVEFINFIFQQVNQRKKDITTAIKEEIKKHISAIDISGEIQKILSKMVIEIKTEIRLVPSEHKKYKSNIRSKINVRYDEGDKI